MAETEERLWDKCWFCSVVWDLVLWPTSVLRAVPAFLEKQSVQNQGWGRKEGNKKQTTMKGKVVLPAVWMSDMRTAVLQGICTHWWHLDTFSRNLWSLNSSMRRQQSKRSETNTMWCMSVWVFLEPLSPCIGSPRRSWLESLGITSNSIAIKRKMWGSCFISSCTIL